MQLWDIDVSDPDLPIALGAPLEGPANYVYAVAFSPDGTALAAAHAWGRQEAG